MNGEKKDLRYSRTDRLLQEAFLELLSEEEGRRTGWIYTAAFGSEDTRKQIERRFGISLVRVPLSVDAFSVDYETMQWFERIL